MTRTVTFVHHAHYEGGACYFVARLMRIVAGMRPLIREHTGDAPLRWRVVRGEWSLVDLRPLGISIYAHADATDPLNCPADPERIYIQ